MDAPKEVQPTGEFTCQLCGLTAPYTYYGQKPPNTCFIVLLEESYVMKDPFTPDKNKFLILGSHCSLCSKSVCVGTAMFVEIGEKDCPETSGLTYHWQELGRSSQDLARLRNVVCSTPKGSASLV